MNKKFLGYLTLFLYSFSYFISPVVVTAETMATEESSSEHIAEMASSSIVSSEESSSSDEALEYPLSFFDEEKETNSKDIYLKDNLLLQIAAAKMSHIELELGEHFSYSEKLTIEANQEFFDADKLKDAVVITIDEKTKKLNIEFKNVQVDSFRLGVTAEKIGTQALFASLVSDNEEIKSNELEVNIFENDTTSSDEAVLEDSTDNQTITSSLQSSEERSEQATETTVPKQVMQNRAMSAAARIADSTKIPPIPSGITAIDVSDIFNASGSTFYQTNNVVNFTGGLDDNSRARNSGQIWSARRINLKEPFTLEFRAYMGDALKELVADGIALTFRNGADTHVGYAGMGMGSYGPNIGKAFTLEMDTYYNPGDSYLNMADKDLTDYRTPDGKNSVGHMAIRESNASSVVGPHDVIHWGNGTYPIAEPRWLSVKFTWSPIDKKVTFDINGNKYERANYDLSTKVADPTNVVWGLTSSTASYDTHQGVFFSKIDMGYGVHLYKKDVVTNALLPGAEFELLNASNQVIKSGLVTGDDGKITVTELKPGTYYFRETKAPAGYTLSSELKSFTIKNTDTTYASVTVTNQKTAILESKKLVDKTKVDIGEKVTYTIVAKNTVANSNTLKNVKIADTIPTGLKLNPTSIKVDGVTATNAVISGNSFSVVIPEIVAGAEHKVTFEVLVTAEAKGTIKNIATVTPETGPPQKPEVDITIVNKPVPLPATGGSGIGKIIMFGSIGVISASGYMYWRMRKEEVI